MKTHQHYCPRLFLTAILVGSCFLLVSADRLHAQTPKPAVPAMDPATHAAHVAAGTHPGAPEPNAAAGDPALSQQLSQLQAKVAQFEAALAKNAPPMAAAPAGAAMPGMPAPTPAASPVDATMPGTPAPSPGMSMGMDKMKPNGGMMGMMEKMMGMMDKMMSTGGPAMGMGDDKKEMADMGGGAAMPAGAPPAGMSGGSAMGMDKMKMAGMMGKGSMGGGASAMPQSALAGFPGASHLYHIGATDFFLDHPQHIALTTEQQAALNKAKEQAQLAKRTADRAVEQGEQELWTLTASDQPDAAKIEGKIVEIAKLTGDARLAFIRAVGEASKLLTDGQRKSLTGFAPPTPAVPPAAPMAPMKGM